MTSNTAHEIKIQEDQKILLAGFLGITPNHNFALARYNTDGSLDNDFGTNGRVITDFGNDDLAFTMALQPDKKIVLAGHTKISAIGSVALSRYLSGLENVKTNEPAPETYNLVLYPNPLKLTAILDYTLTKDQTINIYLYDLAGKLIQTIVKTGQRSKGVNHEVLHFKDNLESGNYILVIDSFDSQTGVNLIIR